MAIPKKPRTSRVCKWCKTKYTPERQAQVCCCVECAENYGKKVSAKAERIAAIEDRKVIKAKLARLKPGYLAGKYQEAVNEYVRIRDFEEGCISCDKDRYWSGQWHAGHLIPVGRSSFLRFHLWNINKQCSQCNHRNGGMVAEHERGIVLRYGQERLDFLKSAPRSRRYDDDYLIRGAKIFRRKTRILKIRKGIQ